FSHSLILKVRGGGTLIFPLWKRLTSKRLILTKNGFKNLNVFFKDLSIDTHHGYIIHGHIDAPELHNEFLRIFAPDNYCRNRKHQLFAIPSCRTVSRAKSPLPRTMKLLNRFLDSKPECDVFSSERRLFLSECLKFCERDE
ncbi:hypothetical protein SFRURICE_014038, partial [Spodoptera frugiperda]